MDKVPFSRQGLESNLRNYPKQLKEIVLSKYDILETWFKANGGFIKGTKIQWKALEKLFFNEHNGMLDVFKKIAEERPEKLKDFFEACITLKYEWEFSDKKKKCDRETDLKKFMQALSKVIGLIEKINKEDDYMGYYLSSNLFDVLTILKEKQMLADFQYEYPSGICPSILYDKILIRDDFTNRRDYPDMLSVLIAYKANIEEKFQDFDWESDLVKGKQKYPKDAPHPDFSVSKLSDSLFISEKKKRFDQEVAETLNILFGLDNHFTQDNVKKTRQRIEKKHPKNDKDISIKILLR